MGGGNQIKSERRESRRSVHVNITLPLSEITVSRIQVHIGSRTEPGSGRPIRTAQSNLKHHGNKNRRSGGFGDSDTSRFTFRLSRKIKKVHISVFLIRQASEQTSSGGVWSCDHRRANRHRSWVSPNHFTRSLSGSSASSFTFRSGGQTSA